MFQSSQRRAFLIAVWPRCRDIQNLCSFCLSAGMPLPLSQCVLAGVSSMATNENGALSFVQMQSGIAMSPWNRSQVYWVGAYHKSLSCSVAPIIFPLCLGGCQKLKWSSPKRVPFFFQGH